MKTTLTSLSLCHSSAIHDKLPPPLSTRNLRVFVALFSVTGKSVKLSVFIYFICVTYLLEELELFNSRPLNTTSPNASVTDILRSVNISVINQFHSHITGYAYSNPIINTNPIPINDIVIASVILSVFIYSITLTHLLNKILFSLPRLVLGLRKPSLSVSNPSTCLIFSG